jgi:hypothetical protein
MLRILLFFIEICSKTEVFEQLYCVMGMNIFLFFPKDCINESEQKKRKKLKKIPSQKNNLWNGQDKFGRCTLKVLRELVTPYAISRRITL